MSSATDALPDTSSVYTAVKSSLAEIATSEASIVNHTWTPILGETTALFQAGSVSSSTTATLLMTVSSSIRPSYTTMFTVEPPSEYSGLSYSGPPAIAREEGIRAFDNSHTGSLTRTYPSSKAVYRILNCQTSDSNYH